MDERMEGLENVKTRGRVERANTEASVSPVAGTGAVAYIGGKAGTLPWIIYE